MASATKAAGLLAFEVADDVTSTELGLLGSAQRKADIFVNRPRKVTRIVRLTMPATWMDMGWHDEFAAGQTRFTNRLYRDGQTICNVRELEIGTWTVPAKDASDYRSLTAKLRENLLTIRARERFGKLRPPTSSGWGFNATTVWLIFILLWFLANLVRTLSRP